MVYHSPVGILAPGVLIKTYIPNKYKNILDELVRNIVGHHTKTQSYSSKAPHYIKIIFIKHFKTIQNYFILNHSKFTLPNPKLPTGFNPNPSNPFNPNH